MGLAETGAYCPHCRRDVLGRKQTCNHVLHALLTLFLCGMWAPVWLVLGLVSLGTSYRCPRCGGPV